MAAVFDRPFETGPVHVPEEPKRPEQARDKSTSTWQFFRLLDRVVLLPMGGGGGKQETDKSAGEGRQSCFFFSFLLMADAVSRTK